MTGGYESAERDNRRGNPCRICDSYHGAGPCPSSAVAKTYARLAASRPSDQEVK